MSNIRKDILSSTCGTILPYDAQIEYIETSGTQYIDTGIFGSMDLDFEITFQPLVLPTANQSDIGGTIFGARTAWNSVLYQLTTYSRSYPNIGTFSWANYAWNSTTNKTLNLSLSKCTITKNGTSFTDAADNTSTMTSQTFTTAYTIYLFALNQKNTIAEYSKIKLYSIKFKRNGVDVLNCIPVRKGQEGYLYDKVSRKLFGNNGTGSFILGSDIASSKDDFGISEVEYLQSDGNQWLALPVYVNRATDALEITYQQTTNTNKCRFLATYYGYNKETNSGLYDSNTCPVNFYIQGTGKYGLWTTTWANAFNATISTFKDTVKIDYKNKKFYVNGYEGNGTGNNTKSTDSNPLFIFLPHSGDVALTKAKLFGFRFWRNNVLLMDCVPVRKRGKGYLYDKINKKYYGNMGTGSWTLGADTGDISKYTRVDYIQNTNNAYIDTGFIPNQDTKVWFDMQLTADQTSSVYPCLFGVRQSSQTRSFRVTFNKSGSDHDLYYEVGTSSFVNIPSEDFPYTKDRVTGEFSKSGLIINEKSFPEPETIADFTSPASLLLFRYVTQLSGIHGTDTDRFLGRMYGFKIWDGETLVRDFVPVRNQLNIYGLWDLIEDKFYPSSSATAFSGGNFS